MLASEFPAENTKPHGAERIFLIQLGVLTSQYWESCSAAT